MTTESKSFCKQAIPFSAEISATGMTPSDELRDMSQRFWISIFFTIPLLLLAGNMNIPAIAHVASQIPPRVSLLLQFALSTPVIIWCGLPLFERGVLSVIERRLNMFTLIASAVSVTFGYSVFVLLFPDLIPDASHETYFAVAATMITLVLMGQVISGHLIMWLNRAGFDQLVDAPIQRSVEMVSRYFVAAILVIAVITFFSWIYLASSSALNQGLISAVSVLIIACPCALGLSASMSIIVGMRRGAKSGILIKNAELLERFKKINMLVVNKTGTLTIGEPVVKSVIPALHENENEILFLAASLESNHKNYLAKAIVNAANERHLDLQKVDNFFVEPGKGIRGTIGGKRVAVGNVKLLELLNLYPGQFAKKVKERQREGETVLFVVINEKVAGLIIVVDPIRPDAALALNAIHRVGIRVMMITGDSRMTAEAVAKSLAIDAIEAGILPQEKNEIIRRLRREKNTVAMAGTGINDVSALLEADVSIVMGADTHIANAGITLVNGDLIDIARTRKLSQKVMRNIRQNLFFVFIYNVTCVPIAAGILFPWTGWLLSPLVGAVMMSLCSIVVIMNALRLRMTNLTKM